MKIVATEHGLLYWCPGCKTNHRVTVSGHVKWDWNGDAVRPTFQPSVKVIYGDGNFCHHFVRDGKIQFLDDCYHELRGRTVEMEDVP